MVLGIAQDGGHPQAGCHAACCAPTAGHHLPASLGLIDGDSRWIIDATPAFPEQLARLDALAPRTTGPPVDGVLLTHAHVGHYAGLVHLGREVMGANGVPVYAMPRMAGFLRDNGPWSLLVQLANIALRPVVAGEAVSLGDHLRATPTLVPHRDEFSETVAWTIQGPSGSVLWLPDLDAWDRWDRDLAAVLAGVTTAYVDGTFFADGELARDMSVVPHPRVQETLAKIAGLPAAERAKIHFVHLNHTNRALDASSPQHAAVRAAGSFVAVEGETTPL